MYLSSWNGNGNRRIPRGVFEYVYVSRNVSSLLKIRPMVFSFSLSDDAGCSEIDRDAAAFGARDADHDLLAAALFVIGEVVVVVQELAVPGDDARLALTAGA